MISLMIEHRVLRTCTTTCRYVFPRDAAERDLACTETFEFSTPNEWPKWRKIFERYLVVSGMKKKEEADKIDLFMYLMGDRADDIFRTFKFEKEEEATKIDSVLKAFDSHFCVRKNIIYERAKFNSRIQEDREPVDEFITSLYKLADSCEFEGLHEQLIRDRIVVGVRDKALSERMQLDSELTLEKAVKMVRQQEAVRQQQVDLQRLSTGQKVNQVKFNSKKQSPKQQQQPSRKKEKSAKTRSRCPKCGGLPHREGQVCRDEGQRCNLCSKTGHFANCCPDKQAKTAEVKAVSELDEEIGFLLEVSAVEDSSNLDDDEGECRRRWTAEIQVNGKQLKFKLDSQADVTCVPLCLFKKIMGQQRLVESDINIRAAEFSELQTVGMFISTLRNGNYEIKEKIYVIRRLSEPLLSRRACELLNLARRIEVVATRINPIKEFPEVFEGLGQIGNPYEIKLKPGAKPYAVHTPRRVPIPLMEKLKTRLEELEKAGIIAQVNVATEWCAPTVIAGKPNGDIRLCVGLSRLNEHVQREVHPMPVVEHMLGQLGEARFFSKLDANSGFHQIPLSLDCQHLTTFITPFGRYKYCRMPFGISLAPEYFQKVMSIILQGMDGVMCYLDDILIFASDSKTHDRILRLVLRKLKEAKVTLNKAKCVFGVPRINFLGHILDEDGIRPDPAKIEAVAKMPAPTDVHGVRRFIGMVNHLGRFVENLSEIVAPLNQLLVKGQEFVWDCSQERALRKLKELLTTQPILAAYDVRKPTMVSSDASSYGLGAVLKQEGKNGIWRPVAYSSRTMTPTEKRYAQIEKEALAITWACERFQDFLLGKRFRIETDHKPLIPLFSTKELSSLTPRLQRFRMRMMRFGFEIVHIPGKELLDADALSRQPLLTTEGGENERQTSAHINAVLSSITDKDEMLTKIFEAQQEDTTVKAVANYLEQGWPDKKKRSQALLSYWHVKDELGVQNGLLMRGCRLVIPASMKLEILDKLHAGHFGITKTRLRARETVWWPGISEEIAETVRKCSVCIQEAVSKHEPLIPTNFPTRPWQKIGMDLFKFENKWYLVVIDYYSRFPEIIQLDRLTASVVVRSCKSIFARHGIPETVVSDNGTQFGAAREFANFARQYGFTHVTSSPRFPQRNGMAEAGVKIAKLILKKNQDPSLGLLEYRSTPLENGYSPAELLMGRKLRTTLPIAPENLNPKLVDSQTLKRKEGRRRKDMKSRYDRRCGATDMEELSEGDTVWITDMRTWGIVKQKASAPRSYMVDTPVGTLRRNRFHQRKGDTVQYPADPSTPTFSGEELVENEKTPVVDFPSNDSEDGQIRTRNNSCTLQHGAVDKSIELKQINSTLSRMEGIKPPAEFVPYSNEKKWETWRESFEIFEIAVNLESMPLVRQRAILKHIAGEKTVMIYKTFHISENDTYPNVKEMLDMLTNHFKPFKNTIQRRNAFFTCVQKERQGIMEFVTELKHLAQECEFENLTESLIRDRLIIGILDREVKRKLLEDPQLTLPRAISIAVISESTCSQVASLNEQKMIEKIEKRNWVKDTIRMENAEAGPSGINPRRERIIEPCKWCGQRHKYGKCPAYGKKCNACGKTNHFSVVCRTKRIRNLLAESEAEESCDEINLNEVAVKTVRSDKWSAVIIINGKKTTVHLDTGAQINVLPHKVINQWPSRPEIRPTSLKAFAYGNTELPIVGKCNVLCQYGEKKGMFEFIVADVEAQTLITGDTCENLEILRRINHINTDEMKLCSETQKILEQYHEVFQGVGLINSECKIYTKPEYSPVQVPPRRIPTSLGAEVQSELEKMVKQGIVTKIYHETEWSHPMVVVKKKIWDSFQNITYVDDLLIYADTIQEHNKKLKGILEKAKEKNIKFDLTKAQICLTKVRFLGHVISQNGIDPEPNKIDKLITFKRPEDKKSLQRIMGLYNYLGKFIPNLAASTSNIRGILRKNVVWHWGPKQDGEFDHIKECVRNAPSLAHFDKSKMLILQCDASKDAMGAALLQEDRPLAFASASFSDSQKQYSQIEKELLSVYYGCKKFEYLLSGHTFVVQTDHQPLLPLVKKPLSDISPRLQRLVMKLIAFDFKLQYKPGKYLIVADTLSRDTHPMDELPTPFLEDKRMVKMVRVNISDEKLVAMQKDTREDPALVKVIDYVIEGWPICKKDVDEDAKVFFDFRHRLYLWNDLLCIGSAIVIPKTQRNNMLNLLHQSHQGISAIQGLARESLFWPRMSIDIAEKVKNCEICQKHQKSKIRQPLKPFPVPDYPWQTVSLDIFYIQKKPHLLVVDRYSGYPEVFTLDPPTAINVKNKLRETFARFGIPETMMSDNGPPFRSEIMTDFCIRWGIKQLFSSPHLHRSNGLAERNIQTIKNQLIKCRDEGSDPYLAILAYRNTPKNDLPSPAQLCLSRSLRCQIPRITPLYRPYQTNWRSIENAKRKRQSSMKEQYDRNSKSYPKVNVGEDAWCQIHPRETWTPVKISAQADSPQSFEVVTPSGNRLIRNQQFIRPRDGGYEKSQLSSEPITASPEAQHPQCDSPTMGESSTAPIQRSSEETNIDQREGATTSAGIAPEPSGRPRFSRSPIYSLYWGLLFLFGPGLQYTFDIGVDCSPDHPLQSESTAPEEEVCLTS
ncbi:K02A2.6-like, partial [Cordylochernes scorpioides]